MNFVKEFMAFLKNYQVIGLAVAVIIGGAATSLVTALVKDVIMPIIGVLVPGGDWQKAVWAVGPVNFAIGDFVNALINFVIIAAVVFLIVKTVMREKDATKKI